MAHAALSQHALSVTGVQVSYDKVKAVKSADFDIKTGEMFGLVGLNGAGKTTLIKSILGLRAQDVGDIKVFDLTNTNKEARNEIVYLPERFDPPWFLSGEEFVQLSLRLYKRPYDKKALYDAAEQLKLNTDFLNKRVQTYSKGMRQKLGLIATILTECKFVILDEPMSGLDPQARVLVKDMLLNAKAKDQTFLICSHILSDLDEICNRIAIIHQGHVDYVGTPKNLKKQCAADNLERAFLHFINDDGAQKDKTKKTKVTKPKVKKTKSSSSLKKK